MIASQQLVTILTFAGGGLPDPFDGSSLQAGWSTPAVSENPSTPSVGSGVASGTGTSARWSTAVAAGTISITVEIPSAPSDYAGVGLLFLDGSTQNGYTFYWRKEPGSAQVFFSRFDSGTSTGVASEFVSAPSYPLTLIATYDPSTDTFGLTMNGTPATSRTNSTYTNLTHVGFMIDSDATITSFDASPFSGGTDYPRSITSTNALTALFGRAVVVTRTETYAASHAMTVARSQVAIRTASRTNAHAATLARAQGLTRTESATDAHAATVTRVATAGRTASTSAAHTAQVSRVGAFVRALSTSISHAVTVARSVTPGGGSNYPRDIASTLSHAASIVRALTATRTATTTDSHAASVTRTGQYTRTASRTNAHAATVARSTGVLRGLAALWGVSAALSRALVATRTLAASVGRSDAISRAAAFGRSVAASWSRAETVARAGTFARGLAQAWSAAVTVAATVTGALFGVDPGGRRLTGAGGRVATEAARMFARLVRGRSVGGRRGTTGAGSRGTTETDG